MKYLKTILKLVLWVIIAFVGLLAVQYVFAPVYDFEEPGVFQGEKIYNPYQNMDTSKWKKANFQVQSRVWGGITDGRNNSNELIDSIYNYLGYDIIVISDYMHINKFGSNIQGYLPVYEHGYSIRKHHHICVGAERVNWRDYAFYQNLNHKQHIIELLRDENKFIMMAHPKLRSAFDPADFKYLRGFDAIEILNFYRVSIAHWDSALSAGNYVVGIGDDDAHDVSNPDEVGQYCTFINTSKYADSIIGALKQGNAYAMTIFRWTGESFEKKKEKLKDVAVLQQAVLTGDTFHVAVDKPAVSIRFIGQNGRLLKEVENSRTASYVVDEKDTYVRTEFVFPNRNAIYLNPVVRSDGNRPLMLTIPEKDQLWTWIYRLLLTGIFVFVLIIIILLRKYLKKKRF